MKNLAVPIAAFVLANNAPLKLIYVHGPNKQEIEINTREISTIRDKRETAEGHFDKSINCIIVMTNGKFIGTAESCRDILDKIADLDKRTPPP